MSTPSRRCTECGKPLAGGTRQLTCSPACRAKRSRRTHRDEVREARANAEPGSVAAISDIVHGKGNNPPMRDAIVAELRPIVREAIDEKVINAIGQLVALTPGAVAALAEDLESDDPVLRQRASTLIVKYTMGNPLVTPSRESTKPPVQINLELPRPAPDAVYEDELVDVQLDEADQRRCDKCRLFKPESEFPAGGPRCATCLAQRKAEVLAAYTDEDAVRQHSPAEDVQRSSGAGRPQVRQAGEGVQQGHVREAGMVPEREANYSQPQGHRPPPRPKAVPEYDGPPDPLRWSFGDTR